MACFALLPQQHQLGPLPQPPMPGLGHCKVGSGSSFFFFSSQLLSTCTDILTFLALGISDIYKPFYIYCPL